MRALDSLHDHFFDRMRFLHAKRFGALWRAVHALIQGQCLWLTAMGRAWPSAAKRKHAIKAIDRLLGNALLHRQRLQVASAAAAMVLPPGCKHPVVLVDTMEIRHKVVAFTASLAHDGRALSIWSTTLKTYRANAAECRRFLRELHAVLPRGCQPILVTDGGFERQWFDEVEKLGWHYVGRVRGQTRFQYRGALVGCLDLHRFARCHPKDLGLVAFPLSAPIPRRLVLSKMPKSQHRRLKTRRGNDNDTNYQHYRKNVHEPLLLATSLTRSATDIVALYNLRMQIEQSFRDLKCHRWGWSMRHCLTRSRARIEILLLIASVAMIAQHLVGIVAEAKHLHWQHQANTERRRRILSLFLLGGIIIRNGSKISRTDVKSATRKMRRKIDHLAGFS